MFAKHNQKILVDWYDLFFKVDVEKEFLLNLIPSGNGSIIEAGCGTGRISIPLAEKGWDVTGFDIDESILQIAQTKYSNSTTSGKISFLKGDMKSKWPNGIYDYAIIALNTIQLCSSREEQNNVLQSAFNSLSTNGKLIISVILPESFNGLVKRRLPIVKDNCIYLRDSSSHRIGNAKRFKTTYRVDVLNNNAESKTYIAYWDGYETRYDDIVKNASLVGFSLVSSYDSYSLTPANKQSKNYICVFSK